uniref:Uncharacterized protein n=1 Tax=Tetranychus urticae TaxID=32264 RepID=T1JYT4_TETUR
MKLFKIIITKRTTLEKQESKGPPKNFIINQKFKVNSEPTV